MKKKPDFFKQWQKAVGRCPLCNRIPMWFNNIPLTAYCWGPPENEHEEASCVVPGPQQPYGKGSKKPRWKITRPRPAKLRKATTSQYKAGLLLYQRAGMKAVCDFAKELGITAWSNCEACENTTPTCKDEACMICGISKKPSHMGKK
jgi:hypothetical protein